MNLLLWLIYFAIGLVETGLLHIKRAYILVIEPTLYDSRGCRGTQAVTFVHVSWMRCLCIIWGRYASSLVAFLTLHVRPLVLVIIVRNPNFGKCQTFGDPTWSWPEVLMLILGRYILVVYSTGGCIKIGQQKSSKWPSFKTATTMLKYIELSEKHTYLGFNCI